MSRRVLALAALGALLPAVAATAQGFQSSPLPPPPGTSNPLTVAPSPPVVPGQTLPAVPPPPSPEPATPAPAPAPAIPTPAAPVEADWLPQNGVVLTGLDKITARPATLSGKVGETLHFGTLAIVVRKCIIRPPDRPAGAAAFLDITDTAPGADPSTAFHGWMFSQYPALAMLQDPSYDIRVTGCTP